MRSLIFAALALGVVACSSPNPDSVETPPANETTPPPSTTTSPGPTTPTPNPTTQPPTSPPVIDPAAAADCDAFGSAYCTKVWSCSPVMANLFVDQAACTARFSGWCKARVTAPATGLTHTALTTCATSITSGSCEALQSDSPPPGCAFKGQLAVNAKCALDEQCASGQCSASSSSCGACLVKNAIGGACTGNDQCDHGLYCTSAKTCAAKPKVGEACSSTISCGFGGSCINNLCVAKAKLGEACDPTFGANPTAPGCKDGLGTQCSSVTKKCELAVFAKLGESCGGSVNGSYVGCSGGTVCTNVNGQNTCQPEVALGGACTKNSQCAMATECHNGVCAFDNASICK